MTLFFIAILLAGLFFLFSDSILAWSGRWSRGVGACRVDTMLNAYLACEQDRSAEKDAAVEAGIKILIEHSVSHELKDLYTDIWSQK